MSLHPTAPHPLQPVERPIWPLQMGQPLVEAKYSQQQCKCNRRQLGTENPAPPNEQMH